MDVLTNVLNCPQSDPLDNFIGDLACVCALWAIDACEQRALSCFCKGKPDVQHLSVQSCTDKSLNTLIS